MRRHTHAELMKQINEAMIDIKLHHFPIEDESAIQQVKIYEARRNHHCPTWPEIVELLRQVYNEISSCEETYRKY